MIVENMEMYSECELYFEKLWDKLSDNLAVGHLPNMLWYQK